MANANFAADMDARLLEAAWHRFDAARELSRAARQLDTAKELHHRAAEKHMKAKDDYDNLERDIARGVRRQQPQAVPA